MAIDFDEYQAVRAPGKKCRHTVLPRVHGTYRLVMYPPPAGQELTAEQAKQLDDTLLSSDPFEYFRSRIASLLAWSDNPSLTKDQPATPAAAGTVRDEFNNYLQQAPFNRGVKPLDVQAQVAADAFSLRHHAAEALVRLACVRLTPEPESPIRCLWAEIATGADRIAEAIKKLHEEAKKSDAGERFFGSVVPPNLRESLRERPQIVDAVNVFADWLAYATQLLSPAEINQQAANNKVKHGLAVRAQADLRVTYYAATPFNADGTIRQSALTDDKAIDIFDQPVLQFLSGGGKVNGHRQGLEVTQLRLRPAALLADAFMLAWAHGAMFHVAAVEHFDRHDYRDEVLGPPSLPGYPVGGPRPHNIDATAPLGMRFPITNPPSGGPPARESGIGYRDLFQPMQIDYENRRQGRVVSD